MTEPYEFIKENYSILHVDDDPAICDIVHYRLNKLNYQVVTAKSGLEALRLLETKVAHLAILDVSLPDMNGYQLAKESGRRV